MRIGFFFDGLHIKSFKNDDFLKGDIGLSGTDSQIFYIISELSLIGDIYFFSNQYFELDNKIKFIQVADLLAAIKIAASHCDIFIFNNRADATTKNGINLIEEFKLKSILWDQNGPDPTFDKLLLHSKFIKRVVCVSHTHANSNRHRVFFNKVTFINNGINLQLFSTGSSAIKIPGKICFIGAIRKEKGFHHLAKAWLSVIEKNPHATLHVIGSLKTHSHNVSLGDLGIADKEFENEYIKPYLGNTLDEIKKNNVFFLGHISPNEMKPIVASCSIAIVNPNVSGSHETFCVSAVEAQALNCWVIGGKSGGLNDTVLDGLTGTLVSNPKKIPEIINKILAEKILVTTKTQDFIKENFDRPVVLNAWVKLINEVINDQPNKLVRLRKKELNLKNIVKEILRWKNKILEIIEN